MTLDIGDQIQELEGLTPGQLRQRHEELFGEASRSSNRAYLVKRIAWRIQALAEGGLCERARKRARKLVDEFGLRVSAPRDVSATSGGSDSESPDVARDPGPRVPVPGTVLVREYKGRELEVTVLADGVLYQGQKYGSLSATARAITGARWSGPLFFGLTKRKRKT